VKTVDMEEAMEKDAIELATFALNEYTVESQMANHIKREFDKKYRYVASRWARQGRVHCWLSGSPSLGGPAAVPGCPAPCHV
jgi:hypothetical protein